MDGDDVAEPEPQVLPDDLVHPDLGLVARVVWEQNADRVLPLLALEQDDVAVEELEAVHGVRVQGDGGVLVVGRLVGHQPVRRLLPLQDRRGVVLLPARVALARHGKRECLDSFQLFSLGKWVNDPWFLDLAVRCEEEVEEIG